MEGAGEKLGDGQRDMGVVLTSIVEAKDNLEESLSNAKNVSTFLATERERREGVVQNGIHDFVQIDGDKESRWVLK